MKYLSKILRYRPCKQPILLLGMYFTKMFIYIENDVCVRLFIYCVTDYNSSLEINYLLIRDSLNILWCSHTMGYNILYMLNQKDLQDTF